jgi:signal transduction histidine kinase
MAMGLRVRMAVSYVLVTLGAVLVVETLLIGLFAPPVIGAQVAEREQINRVHDSATTTAVKLSGQLGREPDGAPIPDVLPYNHNACNPGDRAGSVMLVLSTDGSVLRSSYPACYPVGSPGPAVVGTSGSAKTRDGTIVWAVEPVLRDARQVATLYVQAPYDSGTPGGLGNVRPLLIPGLVVLAAALPVGLLFGYVTMHRPVRRLRRLAATTQALADGDLDRRIPVRGRDELSRLEQGVNRMAEQLSLALSAERDLAGAHARTAERSRIARELHDSVSQELFSLRLLAGGIHRVLPADSPLRPQVESLARSADTASRDLRALLLELRPVALADAGLVGALGQLASAYRTRLGVTVHTRLDEVSLSAEQEHALLRIAQEALVNAVRHGSPSRIAVELTAAGLTVTDDGAGFDLGRDSTGMGLALMRERAAAIGAGMTVHSAPGAGTTVHIGLS